MVGDWHGWSRQGSDHGSLHVGYLSGRKSPCLYVDHVSGAVVLAYFRSEVHARQALAWLDDYSGQSVAPEEMDPEMFAEPEGQ